MKLLLHLQLEEQKKENESISTKLGREVSEIKTLRIALG